MAERPFFLTQRDITRQEISDMEDERGNAARIAEASLCRIVEQYHQRVDAQRKYIEELKREAKELEELRRSMAPDDIAWCSLQDGVRRYRKVGPEEPRKESVDT